MGSENGPSRSEYDADRKADRIERRRDPGPTGEQYAEDRQTERARRILTVGILIAVGVLALLNVYGTFIKNPQDRRTEDRAIRLSQFNVCVRSGNALRDQVRSEFVDLKVDALVPVFQKVRDTIPPTEATYQILDDSIHYLRHRARTIENRIPDAACVELYPPLEGQTYPEELVEMADS